MPTTLEFHVQPETSERYRLEVFERGNTQPLARTVFDYPLSFMTPFEMSRLDVDAKDPAGRYSRLQDYGYKLYQKLFTPEMQTLWQQHKRATDFLTLCLRIAPEAAGLEALPWETLHDGEEFLAAGAKTGMSRLPRDIAPQENLPSLPAPLKMLAFIASPLDLSEHERLQIEAEQELLLQAVNAPAGQGRLYVDFEDEAKLPILESSLEAGYHIWHYSGHGISPQNGGGLLLEDAEGKRRPTAVHEILQALQKAENGLRLAVLSGCQTAATLHVAGFRDLARGLLQRGVPGVIAMQFSISDNAGLLLAETLYPKLAAGQPLEMALSATRRVLLQHDEAVIKADAFAPVLLTANGQCLKTEDAPRPQAAALPREIKIDFSFHLPLAQLSFGFYGRRREYRQIRDGLLFRNHRAVIVHGIGGIGKTSLASHAAKRLQRHFKGVYAFNCSSGTLSPERIVLELHRYFERLGVQVLQPLVHQSIPPADLATDLAQVLCQIPLLLIFDNFESQLTNNEHPGSSNQHPTHTISDANLRTFLITLLKATATGTRFFFTSRYLFDLEAQRLGTIQELPLADLSRPEALGLMQKLPHLAQSSYWEKVYAHQMFKGHPYALVTLDCHCAHQPLSKILLDAKNVQAELREFLAIALNYEKLSERARELLNCMAAFRQAVPLEAAEWVVREQSSIVQNLERPIAELISWGLLTPINEDGQLAALSVHNLVRDFCCEQQAGATWRERLHEAAAFYTSQTKLVEQESKTQEAVWHEMEAFELLLEAEDFEAAANLVMNADPLLDRWGFGHYLESRYRRLIEGVSRRTAAKLGHNLGVLVQARGDYAAALLQYEKSLKIEEEIGNRAGVAGSLYQIGYLHYLRGDYAVALVQYEKTLLIQEELGDRAGVASSLHQVGMVYQARGDYDAALQQYEKSRKINEELGNSLGVANALHQIGIIHQARGDYVAALAEYEEARKIREALNSPAGVASSLHQIGMIHQARGEYAAALQHYEKSLKIFEELDDRAGVADSLNQIGNLYYLRGDHVAALAEYEKSLKIAEGLGNRAGVARSLHQIGVVHQTREDYAAASRHYEKSLQILEELGDRAGVATSLHQSGNLHYLREDYAVALQQYEKSLRIKEELGNRAGVGNSLNNIGAIHQARGDYGAALLQYEKSLQIQEELGNRVGVATSLHQIGNLHFLRGDYTTALQQYEKSLHIEEELGNRPGVAETRAQIGQLLTQTGRYSEAFEHLLFALDTFVELQSLDAGIAANALNDLRKRWGAANFEAAWQQATGEPVP